MKGMNRCIANCKNGTKCGRCAAPGEQLCSIHRPGTPQPGGHHKPDDLDHLMRKLARLTHNSKPEIQLRAIDLLLSLRPKDPPVDVDDSTRDRQDAWRRMTGDQLSECREHLAALHALETLARTQALWVDDRSPVLPVIPDPAISMTPLQPAEREPEPDEPWSPPLDFFEVKSHVKGRKFYENAKGEVILEPLEEAKTEDETDSTEGEAETETSEE
jgi:hypothetical protein